MQKTITIKEEYNSLDNLHNFLKTASNYECSKEYDIWEQRIDTNGQMAQCLVLKKSNMHAIKAHLINNNTVKIQHIIPSKVMQAYFGKSQEQRQNIIEIITGKIKEVLLKPAQEKAFNELEEIIKKAS